MNLYQLPGLYFCSASEAINDLSFYIKQDNSLISEIWKKHRFFADRVLRLMFALGYYNSTDFVKTKYSEEVDRIESDFSGDFLKSPETETILEWLTTLDPSLLNEFLEDSGLNALNESKAMVLDGIDQAVKLYFSTGCFWQKDLRQWETYNINDCGRYCGRADVKKWFGYKPGDYIPVSERYSAMLQWRWAVKVLEMKARHQ